MFQKKLESVMEKEGEGRKVTATPEMHTNVPFLGISTTYSYSVKCFSNILNWKAV